MTRKRAFKKLAILFVKMDEAEKERLEKIAKDKGFSTLSEFVRLTLRGVQ